jgi:RimJ/RimL family protein N-acetyltransferase
MNPALTHIETTRLHLRVPQEADFPHYLRWYEDEQTQRGLGLTRAVGWEVWRSLAMMCGHWHLRGFGMWTMVEKATGALVGRAGLFFPEGWPGLEVGWLVAPEARGRGYATEVGAKAITLAFTVLKVGSVCSIIAPENTASIAVATRLGETHVGSVSVRDISGLSLYQIDEAAFRKRVTG